MRASIHDPSVRGLLLLLMYLGFVVLGVALLRTFVASKPFRLRPVAARRFRAVLVGLCVPASYCSTWSFYGMHAKAMNGPWAYLGFYAGPATVALLWPFLLKKLVTVSQRQSSTDLVSFVCRRYGDSTALKAVVSGLVLAGTAPYLSVQLLGMSRAIVHVSGRTLSRSTLSPVLWSIAMLVFVFLFVLREREIRRHVALQGVVMLSATAVLLWLLMARPLGVEALTNVRLPLPAGEAGIRSALQPGTPIGWWLSTYFASMLAIMFLPRQFHILTQETGQLSPDEVAKWSALCMISFFLFFGTAVTIIHREAMSFLGEHAGITDEAAIGERLPLLVAQLYRGRFGAWPVRAVLLGGFAAGLSTISCQLMALGNIVSHHLFALKRSKTENPPETEEGAAKYRNFQQWTYLWALAVFLFIAVVIAWCVPDALLANLGMISFLAAAQLAPSILGGIYWRKATTAGAISGVSVGAVLWLLTIVIPSLLPARWLGNLGAVLPQGSLALLGTGTVAQGLTLSLGANVLAFLLVSLFTAKEDDDLINGFVLAEAGTLGKLNPEVVRFVTHRLAAGRMCSVLAFLAHNEGFFYTPDEIVWKGRFRASILPELNRLVALGFVTRLGERDDRDVYVYLPSVVGIEERTQATIRDVARSAALVENLPRYIRQTDRESRRAFEDEQRRRLDLRVTRGLGHSLKSRVGLIQAWAEILETRLDGEHQDALDMINDSCAFLLRANDLFRGIQKLHAKDVLRGRVEISQLLEGIVARYGDARVELLPSADAPVVMADRAALEEIFDQLIQNARDFTPPKEKGGRITVSLEQAPEGCMVLVADNGPGIRADVRERLFEPESRHSDDRLGLGLSIVKGLVELQGGDIRETGDRQVGKKRRRKTGACFEVVLPALNGELGRDS